MPKIKNKELEIFRKASIDKLRKDGKNLKKELENVLNVQIKNIYIIGSVIDPEQFTENSDIDIAILINSPKYDSGPVLELAQILFDGNNNGYWSYFFGSPDWIVLNAETKPSKGIKIA